MTGDYLKQSRLAQSFTQDDVAHAIGVSRTMVHSMETRGRVPVRLIKPLAKVLNIHAIEIIERMSDDYFIRIYNEVGLNK